jgi:hypothetical protein
MKRNARMVTQRVIARIRSSDYLLVVYYPHKRPALTGAARTSLPASPLVASPNPKPTAEEEADRSRPEVEMPCLFLETSALGELRQREVTAGLAGWTKDTSALARVTTEDADLTDGNTVFDGCDFVEVSGRRYRVQNVVRQASSVTDSGTYYVLLTGAGKWTTQQ